MSGFFRDIEREGRRVDRQLGIRASGKDLVVASFPEPAKPAQVIEEGAEGARKRQRRKLARGGKRSTIIGGIMSALKKRLGE